MAIIGLFSASLLAGCATFQEMPGLDAANSALIRVVRQPDLGEGRQPWLMDFSLSINRESLGHIEDGLDRSFRLPAGVHEVSLSVPQIEASYGQIGYRVHSVDQMIEVGAGETHYWVFAYERDEQRMTGLLAPESQWQDYLSRSSDPLGNAAPLPEHLLDTPLMPGSALPSGMTVLTIRPVR